MNSVRSNYLSLKYQRLHHQVANIEGFENLSLSERLNFCILILLLLKIICKQKSIKEKGEQIMLNTKLSLKAQKLPAQTTYV